MCTINFCPLVGLPSPSQLHAEDSAFQGLLLSGMGVRATAERMSLLVSHQAGMQAPSVVESVLAATASDLVLLLSGTTPTSHLARDSLFDAQRAEPEVAPQLSLGSQRGEIVGRVWCTLQCTDRPACWSHT